MAELAFALFFSTVMYWMVGAVVTLFSDRFDEGWATFFHMLLWPVFLCVYAWRGVVWLKDEIVDGEVAEGWRTLFPRKQRPTKVPEAKVVRK